GLPDMVRNDYKDRLAKAWLAHAQADLEAEQFEQARTSATALNVWDASEQAAGIIASASAALEVKKLIDLKEFEQAGKLLADSGDKLPKAIHERLHAIIVDGASKSLPRLGPDTPYAEVIAATGKFLKANPGNPAGLKLRFDAGLAQVKAIEELLAKAAAGDPASDATFEMLKQLVKRAKSLDDALQMTPYKNVADKNDAHIRAQAFRLIGQAHELMDDPTGAFSAYGYLANPAKAQPEQLELLLARIEFLYNPRWERYRSDLGIQPASRAQDLTRFSIRALEILAEAEAGPELRARAYADRGLAHAVRSRLNLPKEERETELAGGRDALKIALATLKQYKLTNKDDWLWKYELAYVLWAQRFQSDKNKFTLGGEATPLLEDALKTAPASEKPRIMDLIKDIEISLKKK
ncbi:MAG: hypothetical protein AB7K24_31675, partial [Gemmataceae bacterium]